VPGAAWRTRDHPGLALLFELAATSKVTHYVHGRPGKHHGTAAARSMRTHSVQTFTSPSQARQFSVSVQALHFPSTRPSCVEEQQVGDKGQARGEDSQERRQERITSQHCRVTKRNMLRHATAGRGAAQRGTARHGTARHGATAYLSVAVKAGAVFVVAGNAALLWAAGRNEMAIRGKVGRPERQPALHQHTSLPGCHRQAATPPQGCAAEMQHHYSSARLNPSSAAPPSQVFTHSYLLCTHHRVHVPSLE